jgi:hypothetical protein
MKTLNHTSIALIFFSILWLSISILITNIKSLAASEFLFFISISLHYLTSNQQGESAEAIAKRVLKSKAKI